jgi:large subunit ribosomal protein L30
MSGKIKITQLKSGIGRKIDQKQTLQALGLKRIRHTVEHTATPQIMGMVKKVQHLIQVQEI